MSIFNEIRAQCAAVAAEARFVRIDRSKLEETARRLAPAAALAPILDPHFHYVGDASTTIAYIVTLDTVNFGSGWFPHLKKVEGKSGYFTVAKRLKEQFETHGAWSAAALEALTPERVATILAQQGGDEANRELMSLFTLALKDLGRHLRERHAGSFEALVRSARGSAAALVEELALMPLFRDVSVYHGRIVPFMKRAQITVADLALALAGHGLGAFRDIDELTIFADNLVPHVLRLDGVLVVDPAIVAKIESGVLIEHDTDPEIELRAVALHAVQEMAHYLTAAGTKTTAVRLDYVLWNTGQGADYKSRPRQRTRTVYY